MKALHIIAICLFGIFALMVLYSDGVGDYASLEIWGFLAACFGLAYSITGLAKHKKIN